MSARDIQLDLFLASRMNVPFVWGRQDCCLFAADWVHALTGWDPAGPEGIALRGTYGDALGAGRALKRYGGVVSIVDTALRGRGWGQIPPGTAMAGDLVAVDTTNGPVAGIYRGDHGIYPGADGLMFLPHLQFSVAAWRIS